MWESEAEPAVVNDAAPPVARAVPNKPRRAAGPRAKAAPRKRAPRRKPVSS